MQAKPTRAAWGRGAYPTRLLIPGFALAAALAGGAGLWWGSARGQEPQGGPALSFSGAQVDAGRTLYATSCGTCHGFNLQGAAGPALSGAGFAKSWMGGAHSARSLFESIQTTMPANAPGSLSSDQVLQLLAYILSKNGVAAGAQPLQVAGLNALIPAGAGGGAPAAGGPSVALPQGPSHVEVASSAAPVDADLLHVAAGNWMTYNRDYAGDRFSPLRQINTDNVARLVPRCMLQFGEMGSFETSPLVYEGTIYLTTPHRTFAVDGQSCKLLWSHIYTPVDAEHIPGNRGAALYHGKLYRGTTDGYLLALDAKSGKLLWSDHVADGNAGAFISGAPLAYDGKVFVGEGGADSGIEGRFYAFDSETGQPLWSFDIIPRPGQSARASWGAGVPRGGSSWSNLALDPQRRLLFIPTGNPGPDFDGSQRPGADLYTDSVVVLHEQSGQLAWYVQQVPHDVHDWDTAAAPAIYDRAGRGYMAVASKDGFVYIYDRSTHHVVARSETDPHRNVDVPFTAGAPVTYCPGGLGQWNGPAYAAGWDLLFVGSADRCDTIEGVARPMAYEPGRMDFGARLLTNQRAPSSGYIRAFDAQNGKQAWVLHSDTPIVAAMTPTAGGLLLTGDLAGHFLAIDAHSGQVLYRFMTGGGVAGGISPYEAGGQELIAVPTGSSSRGTWGSTGSATLIVFGLP